MKSYYASARQWLSPCVWLLICAGFVPRSPAILDAAQEGKGPLISSPADAPALPDLASPPADAVTTGSGIAMKVLHAGSGIEHPRPDDCVVLSFTGWRRDGSLFSTSGLHGESEVQCLVRAVPAISEALQAMVSGEKRRIWIPAHAFAFQKTLGGHAARPLPDLVFDLELIRILKTPVQPADLRNPPPTAFTTPSGVVLEVLRPGSGSQHPGATSWVTLHYSGWTSDGKLFESTLASGHPAVVLLGTALPGWREALPYMVVGEKARIWIPAALAYGRQPMQEKSPAGDLVYDIDLLSVR